ncbi:MAG: hypothetical protein ACM3SU_10495 [Acidobacteriota bacterium]
MLRPLRTARASQIVLCLAAILAVGGSFGLHPEPGGGALSAAPAGFSILKITSAPHGCLACLTHGAALATPLSGLLLGGAPAAPASLPGETPLSGRLAGLELPGRSPPARS